MASYRLLPASAPAHTPSGTGGGRRLIVLSLMRPIPGPPVRSMPPGPEGLEVALDDGLGTFLGQSHMPGHLPELRCYSSGESFLGS